VGLESQISSVDIPCFLMYFGNYVTFLFSLMKFPRMSKMCRFGFRVVDIYSLPIFFPLSFIVILSSFFLVFGVKERKHSLSIICVNNNPRRS
jgi:hypothetical protein